MNKETLQRLYDDCNWYGYAMYKGKRINTSDVLAIAKEKSIDLKYNCPN